MKALTSALALFAFVAAATVPYAAQAQDKMRDQGQSQVQTDQHQNDQHAPKTAHKAKHSKKTASHHKKGKKSASKRKKHESSSPNSG